MCLRRLRVTASKMASELIDIMDIENSASIQEESDSGPCKSLAECTMDQVSPTLDSSTSKSRPTISQRSLMRMTSGSKKGPKIRSGLWLAAGIPREYLVNGIPIAGVINEHGVPRPSLRGPDIWPTEETIEEVTRMAELNDWPAIQETKSAFHLAGPQKNQLRDAYIWIALRQDVDDGSFVMSESARNRLVPKWRELVESTTNGPFPATFDLRQTRCPTASPSDLQMHIQGVLGRLNDQNAVITSLSQRVECQATAIKQLTESIDAEALVNQQVVTGLQQVERAMEGPLGGCRQQ